MPEYRVTWEIDIFDVGSPTAAAAKALEIQRDPKSTATVFTVRERDGKTPAVTVDVTPEDHSGERTGI